MLGEILLDICFNEMLVISMSVSGYQISRSMFCKSLMCLENSIKVVTQQISVLLCEIQSLKFKCK